MPNTRQPNISFGNASGAEVNIIPLRLVAIADLAPESSSVTAAGPRLRNVDKDTYNDILRAICPGISLHLQDPHASQRSLTRVDIPLEDLKSFHPAALVQNVEFLRSAMGGRQALLDLRDRKLSRDQFMEKLKSSPMPFLSADLFSKAPQPSKSPAPKPPPAVAPMPAPAPSASGSGSLDAILNMVEAPADRTAPASQPPEGRERVQQFINVMMGTSDAGQPVDRTIIENLLVEADGLLSDRMNAILEHPEFSRLETAWRSLKFLIDRTDFRTPIQLQVVAAKKEDLLGVLDLLLEEAQVAETPVAAIITDFEFDCSAPDMELLRQAAERSEQLLAPLIVNVGPAFFGKPNATEVSTIPLLKSHLESPEFVKWSGFRESELSRWVGAAFNRFLARVRFDESSGRIAFRMRERREGVWGNASWAVASLLVRSFAANHWCGHITGIQGGGLVESLPLHDWRFPSGEETRIPLETLFLHGREDDFSDAGFLVFQSGQDQDMAVLLRAPTAHKPERYPDARDTETARLRATLAYQMVASRFVQYLGPLLRKHLPAASPAEMQQAIERGLRAQLGAPGARTSGAVAIEFRDSESRSGFWDVTIKIVPGPSIWPLSANIDLIIPVKKF